jgi:hypothetical protein
MRWFLFCILFFYCFIAFAQDDYPVVSIPVNSSTPITFHEMRLEQNPPRDLDKKIFNEVKVEKGDVLEISSFVVSHNLLAVMSGLTRDTDAPTFGEIESNIDTNDRTAFLQLLLKIGLERRHAETDKEWTDIVSAMGGRDRRARFNPYLYSTPYIEVAHSSLKHSVPGIRYFVPIKQVLDGAVTIDVKNAKLTVISGLALMMFKEFSREKPIKNKAKLAASLSRMGADLSGLCENFDACTLTGDAPVGLLFGDLALIYRAGADLNLSGSKLSTLMLRKQICVFKALYEICPRVKSFALVPMIEKREKLDCDSRESILKGLIPK